MKTRRPKATPAGKKQGVAKRKRKSLAGLMPLEPRVMYDAAGAHTAASHLIDPHHADPIHAAATGHVADTSPAAAPAHAPVTPPVTTHPADTSPTAAPVHAVASRTTSSTSSTTAPASTSSPSTAGVSAPTPSVTESASSPTGQAQVNGADGLTINLTGVNLVSGNNDTARSGWRRE